MYWYDPPEESDPAADDFRKTYNSDQVITFDKLPKKRPLSQ